MESGLPVVTATWSEAKYDALQRVITSGIFTMELKLCECEKQFASYLVPSTA